MHGSEISWAKRVLAEFVLKTLVVLFGGGAIVGLLGYALDNYV